MMDNCTLTSGKIPFRALSCALGLILSALFPSVSGTECTKYKRKYIIGIFGAMHGNNTIKCPMSFQWTVNDFCCYDRYDRFEEHPYCCYSEAYKLALAVGFIFLVLFGSSFSLFFCWFYNLPHHILYILTCRKFRLNDWLEKNRNGPYVDPSFYSGEPFWAGGDVQPYPLRPMPPRIFYPAPPPNMKLRWDMGSGELPLFILASRQFHRNPYSARPNERATSSYHNILSDSRRSSVTTLGEQREGTAPPGGRSSSSNYGRRPSHIPATMNNSEPVPFKINIDEAQAASELIEAVRIMDEKSDEQEVQDAAEANKTSQQLSTNNPITNAFGQSVSNNGGGGISMGGNSSNGYRNSSSTFDNVGSNLGDCSSSPRYNIYSSDSNRDNNSFGNTSNQNCQSGCSSSGAASVQLRGGKISVEALNLQLSNSLSLSINNLPSLHVFGNFGNNGGMETIEEDGPFEEGEMDYYPTPPFTPPPPLPVSSIPPTSSQITKESSTNKQMKQVDENKMSRISSALDKIVTRARAEVPFRPSLPGSIPENPGEHERDLEENRNLGFNLEEISPIPNKVNLISMARRNSAPVHF